MSGLMLSVTVAVLVSGGLWGSTLANIEERVEDTLQCPPTWSSARHNCETRCPSGNAHSAQSSVQFNLFYCQVRLGPGPLIRFQVKVPVPYPPPRVCVSVWLCVCVCVCERVGETPNGVFGDIGRLHCSELLFWGCMPIHKHVNCFYLLTCQPQTRSATVRGNFLGPTWFIACSTPAYSSD